MGGVLGALKGTYRVYSRYIRIRGLRAHTRGPLLVPERLGTLGRKHSIVNHDASAVRLATWMVVKIMTPFWVP